MSTKDKTKALTIHLDAGLKTRIEVEAKKQSITQAKLIENILNDALVPNRETLVQQVVSVRKGIEMIKDQAEYGFSNETLELMREAEGKVKLLWQQL